jgi:hypothetical protein
MRSELKTANEFLVPPFFKRVLLAMMITGAAAIVCGCLSVHVHKEEQPSPVIVVPNDHPNP